MQAIAPVDIHVENDWHNKINSKKHKDQQITRIRTRAVKKTKNIPKQTIKPKLISPVRSQSPSPNRGPWVPAPGRSTKGQKISWQSSKSRLEINPVTEIIIDDDLNTDRSLQNTITHSPPNTPSTETNDKLMNEIQIYEKRIQGLIDGIGMLKDRITNHASQEQTDQLRSEIDSSLLDLEQIQQNSIQTRSRSRSPSTKEQKRSTTPKVSFQDDQTIIEKRRPRSTTPIQGPIYLNPEREELLISLTKSESDITQIIKQLSSVKDNLTRLKFDDQTVSFEVDQLYRNRNELLHSIEQYEQSNRQLKDNIRHQYHLEAEHAIQIEQNEALKMHINELQHENQHIRHVLLDRENDNIMLLNELERIRNQTIGFDTMKTSLEHNRAHLQRELYTKEGEINRLQCALRSLERDLQRSRQHCGHLHRSMKRPSLHSLPTCSSPPPPQPPSHPSKALTTERLIDQESQAEIAHLRTQLEQAEQLANEYQAQLRTQTLKTSANNSRNHLSEIELEKIRLKLQKRIEELEPLPELLKQAEYKNEILQKQINDLQKHQTPINADDQYRILQRRVNSLEEQNQKLTDELRVVQSSSRRTSPEPKYRDDSKFIQPRIVVPQPSLFDLEQQIARLRLEYNQLKHEKDDLERRFNTQLTDMKSKLDQSNNTNRSMQNYLNSLKTTYVSLFNETIPT